jgi:hypothetical protein
MNVLQRILHRPFFIRLFNWEYWSFTAVYLLIYPLWIWLCLRARSFFFFAAANPRIKNGGFLNESKQDLEALIPDRYHPKTVFFAIPANGDIVWQQLQQHQLSFPLIGKPNVGGRGRGVKVLTTKEAVKEYVSQAYLDFHIQEYVPWKNEVGIFYYRYPDQPQGVVSGIVKKEFLSVTGDGSHTIRQLLQQSKRALMYMTSLEALHGEGLNEVLPAGETKVVSPYGNHARGAMFLDHSYLIDARLTATIDAICKEVPEFYYGRLDIRYNTIDELKEGRNMVIIEINGAGSEPTHIYDPRHSLFFAWKEIVRHWFILGKISRMNHRKGHPYLTWKQGVQMFREDKDWSGKLAAMTE